MQMAKKRTRKDHRQRRGKAQEAAANDEKSALAWRWAKAGMPVVPLHGSKDGRCTCGKPDCRRPGAHPRTENDVFDATTEIFAPKETSP
jgi:hypothetical protein